MWVTLPNFFLFTLRIRNNCHLILCLIINDKSVLYFIIMKSNNSITVLCGKFKCLRYGIRYYLFLVFQILGQWNRKRFASTRLNWWAFTCTGSVYYAPILSDLNPFAAGVPYMGRWQFFLWYKCQIVLETAIWY